MATFNVEDSAGPHGGSDTLEAGPGRATLPYARGSYPHTLSYGGL